MAQVGTRVKVEGLNLISSASEKLLRELLGEAGEILTEDAEILQDEAVKLAPGPTGQPYGKYKHPPGTLKKSIKVGEVRSNKKGISQAVGIEKNQYFSQKDLFYARFQEMGTSKMPASPFMRPALVKRRAKVREHTANRLKEQIFHD